MLPVVTLWGNAFTFGGVTVFGVYIVIVVATDKAINIFYSPFKTFIIMAKISWGILDGFIGKVGTVVGSFWKGKPVMRAYKHQITNRNSEAQQLVRTRFAAIGALASSYLHAIRLGLKSYARSKQMTESDVFVKLNWDFVHAIVPGTATIDYADLTIAKGNLPEVQFGTASFATPLTVTVAMSDTASAPGSDADDLAYLFVYSPEAGAGVLSSEKKRTEASIDVEVPDYWVGQRVHVYGFATGVNGNISNSRYLGSGTIS